VTAPRRPARLLYETPGPLVGEDEASPGAMRAAFTSDIARLTDHHDGRTDLVAVQGAVSSMKTWLLACTAEEFLTRAQRVAALVPQRVNRRSLVGRLEQFGVQYIEHPGRHDLCAWDPWKELVGQVDERICSSNGCPMYPDDRDLERLADDALAMHHLTNGEGIQLDEQTIKDLASKLEQPVCPHYLQTALAESIEDEEPVRVATYAKAFQSDDAGEWLAADVALLDESHTVATDLSHATTEVNPLAITAALATVRTEFEGSATKRGREIARDIEPLESAIRDWAAASREFPVTPGDLFDEAAVSLRGAFDVLGRARRETMAWLRSAVETGRSERADWLAGLFNQVREVVEFLSRVQSHRDGGVDFIHTRSEERGEAVNDIEFRRVADREAASTPREVYKAWQEAGTHPAIAARWGDLLDHHLEAVWAGRTIVPGGDRDAPGAPRAALADLRSITGADTLVGFSATHNEVSDPERSPGDLRRTAHQLVTAPLQLRSDGDESPGYHGRTSVDAATPWFQALVRQAKEEAGARLAAVPINGTNEAKWEAMPVETLELPTSGGGVGGQAGLVPHSRGAIGAKDLEQLPIDAVLCGVQVQGPAATARRVVALWELLAPEHDDPTDALERGWRLLAQHAVSGTIQAAGRFRTDAPNIVFERPELVELAGFECEPLSPSMDGFAGALADRIEATRTGYEHRRRVIRAVKVVAYLRREASKSPTRAQYLSMFKVVHGATDAEATRAFEAAVEAGRLEYAAGTLRVLSGDEAGAAPGG